MRGLFGAAIASLLLACPTPAPRLDAGGAETEVDAGPTCDGGQIRNHLGECLVSGNTPGFDCLANPVSVPFPPERGMVTVSGDPTGFPSWVQCEYWALHASLRYFTRGVAFVVNLRRDDLLRAWADEPGVEMTMSPSCPVQAKCFGAYDLSEGPLIDGFGANDNTRYLWISSPGPFTAHFRRSPAQQCAHAEEITLSDAGVFSMSGDLSNYFDRLDGPIAVFHLQLPTTSDVVISGGLADGGSRLVKLAPDCAEVSGGVDSLRLPGVAGHLYFGLTGPGRARDFPLPFTIEVQATPPPPPPPSACDNPVPLAFVSDGGVQVATFSGATNGLPDDLGPWCVYPTLKGPSQIFTFTTTAALNIDALVSTSDVSFRPAISMRAGGCSAGEFLCNVAILPGAAARVTANLLPPRTYFIAVGSEGTAPSPDGGVFTLRVTLTP